jgi:hypothetical protein
MNFTFGIVTNATKGVSENLIKVIESIQKEEIPQHEVIVVGTKGQLVNKLPGKVRIVDFDDTRKKKGWITAKKNAVTRHAKYDNIVYQHDYVTLCDGWYEGWKKFGDKFSLCMNPILNKDGTRFRDWSMFPHPFAGGPSLIEQARAYAGSGKRECLLPYEETGFTKLMYFSGAYWVAKKKTMMEFPLDEGRCWGQGEDVEWSYRVRTRHKFTINVHSKAQLLKQKARTFKPLKEEHRIKMKEFLQQRNQYMP